MFIDTQNPLVLGLPQPALFARLSKEAKKVFVMEGRPFLTASREASSQLLKRKVTPVLISDNMAGFLFYNNLVKEVWISYFSESKDGLLCNIGALILGVLGKKHKVPVYAVVSRQKTDIAGKPKDIFEFQNKRVAPKGIKGYVPLVEWVPKNYISKIDPK